MDESTTPHGASIGLRSIDGVSSVKVRVMKELIVVQDWLKGELDKRVSA